MDELFEKIKIIIAEKLEVDERKITLGASFSKDLGIDSLDAYELLYAVEEELGITIPEEEANKFKTVKDAYEYIMSPNASNGTAGADSTGRANDINGREEERSNVDALQKGGEKVGHSEYDDIHHAASKGTVDDARYFIEEEGVNVNAKSEERGMTPLHYAASYGNVEVAKFLISKGANVNAQAAYYETPLHAAARNGNVEIVKLLVSKGADVHAEYHDYSISGSSIKRTALDIAKQRGNEDVVKYLSGIK